MGSRHMVYWRVYVYANNLYSLPGSETNSYRDWTPSVFRCQPNAVHRILSFANRDLSVLICSNQLDILNVFDILLDLLLEVNMKSVEFSATLAAFLGPQTNHFVHELINFARSPYDDLISYECNVQYRARAVPEMEGDAEMEMGMERVTAAELLPGLHSFVDFSSRVDDDECIGLYLDLDLEDEDPEDIDEEGDQVELNSPHMLELRRLFHERNLAALSIPQQPPNAPSSSVTTAAQQQQQPVQRLTTGPHYQQPGTGLPDLSLEMALGRSTLHIHGPPEYFLPRSRPSQPQMLPGPPIRNMPSSGSGAGGGGAIRGMDPGVPAASTSAVAAAAASGAAGAQNPTMRSALRINTRPRSSAVPPKRRRTTHREPDH